MEKLHELVKTFEDLAQESHEEAYLAIARGDHDGERYHNTRASVWQSAAYAVRDAIKGGDA